MRSSWGGSLPWIHALGEPRQDGREVADRRHHGQLLFACLGQWQDLRRRQRSKPFLVDAATGKEMWRQNLGTIQKASPVYADGKIYVGTENGKFFILKPGDKDCQVLDVDDLSKGAGEEEVIASVAVARGRIYLVSTETTYCIGAKQRSPAPKAPPAPAAPAASASTGAPAFVQVLPAELIVAPGKEISFKARSFDAAGNLIGEQSATWSLAGLQGNISPEGKFSSPKGPQGGEVRAAVGGVTGAARVRVIPPLPWTEDFESLAPGSVPAHWVGVMGKYQIRDVEGNKVMVKLPNEQSLLRRCRSYMGPSNLSNYTIEADVWESKNAVKCRISVLRLNAMLWS